MYEHFNYAIFFFFFFFFLIDTRVYESPVERFDRTSRSVLVSFRHRVIDDPVPSRQSYANSESLQSFIVYLCNLKCVTILTIPLNSQCNTLFERQESLPHRNLQTNNRGLR